MHMDYVTDTIYLEDRNGMEFWNFTSKVPACVPIILALLILPFRLMS